MATSLGTAGPPSNTRFLGPIRVHSPNIKSIGSAVVAQLSAESAYTLQWGTLSPRISAFHGGSGPLCKTRFLGPTRVHTPNAISIRLAVFPQTTVECPYTLQWDAHSPPNVCPFPWGIWTPSNTWSLGPTQVLNPNGISIGSAFLQGSLVLQTDRPTDRPRYSVSNNRPYLCT